jgi:hypothetical protein
MFVDQRAETNVGVAPGINSIILQKLNMELQTNRDKEQITSNYFRNLKSLHGTMN